MRSAPPVAVDCRSHRGWEAAVWTVRMLAAGVAAAWVVRWLTAAPLVSVGVVLAACAAVEVGRRRARVPSVRVAWDGERWTWDERPGAVTVVLDLGSCMLLRFDPTDRGRSRWLAAQPVDGVAPVQALRAALFGPPSRATAGAR